MIKLISFIVLTQFLHFNELQFFRHPGYFIFLKLNQQYLFCEYSNTLFYSVIVTYVACSYYNYILCIIAFN